MAARKIGADYHVNIHVETKDGGTIQFTITADSRTRANNAVQHIQGEFCDVSEPTANLIKTRIQKIIILAKVTCPVFLQFSAQRKYDSQYLPSDQVKEIRGPHEAQKRLSENHQQILQGEGNIVLLTEDALRKHDVKHMTGPCELRQFGCGRCDHSWWRTVPVSKMVSRCKVCQIRYDALPRRKEFGVGRFQCTKPRCERIFFAKCQATDILRCRKCKTLVKNPHIHPRWRKPRHTPRPRRPRSSTHQNRSLNPSAAPFVPGSQQRHEPSSEPVSLHGRLNKMSLSEVSDSSYYPSSMSQSQQSQSQGDYSPMPVAPQQRPPDKPKVKNASRVHNSSGSTMSTFITQMDESEFDEVALDYDSDEEGVGACRFECDCGNRYTVLCEMTDTARCYKCDCDNEPMGWAPPRNIDSETSNPHSCSKCHGHPGCPNLLAVAGILS